MKEILKTVLEVGKSSVLDGSVNAADLKTNKKKVAMSLAKGVAWQLVQRHPLFMVIKLGLYAGAAVLALIIIALLFWLF